MLDHRVGELRVEWGKYERANYQTGYKQFLLVRQWVKVMDVIGLRPDESGGIVMDGVTITPEHVKDWLASEPKWRTFGNWRTNYNHAVAAQLALDVNGVRGVPRSAEETRLWEIVSRWVGEEVLKTRTQVTTGAENAWDQVAVNVKAHEVAALCRNLKKKPTYAEVKLHSRKVSTHR